MIWCLSSGLRVYGDHRHTTGAAASAAAGVACRAAVWAGSGAAGSRVAGGGIQHSGTCRTFGNQLAAEVQDHEVQNGAGLCVILYDFVCVILCV